MGKDRILRATGEIAELRFVVIDATTTANEIGSRHGAQAYMRVLLGETMVSSLLLASGLKKTGTLQTRFRFSGDISYAAADATPLGLVRAMIPAEEVRAAGAFELLLSPQIMSVKKIDEYGSCYNEGMVEMATSHIGPCTAFYLLQSEQSRSAVGIQARCGHGADELDYCAGFLVEAFPKADAKTIAIMEEVVRSLSDFGQFWKQDEGFDLEKFLDFLAGPFKYQIHKEIPVQPFCPCSLESVKIAMSSLGRTELQNIIDQNQTTELHCEFCRKRYLLTPQELREVLADLGID